MPSPEWVKNLGMFSVILTELIAYTASGIFLGYMAWAKLQWPWWTLLITSILGVALGMYRVYQVVLLQQKREQEPQ